MTATNTTGLFKVLRASAGSGKTYSLVKEFLLLALKTKSADYYKNILAITFTNAAAAEMKERVILRLKEIAENVQVGNSLQQELIQTLDISPEELQERSAAAYKHILHNYGQLSIQTIDGFTHKLIRAFARELRLSQDFAVELNTDEFLELLADKCLDSIGQDDEITRYLEQFALENLEEGSGWNIRLALIEFAKQLLKEDAHNALQKLEHLKLDDFKRIKQHLSTNKKVFENRLKQLTEACFSLLKQNGLGLQDFSNGASGGLAVFVKARKDEFAYPGSRFFDMLDGKGWYAKKAPSHVVESIEGIRVQLHQFLVQTAELFSTDSYSAYLLQSMIIKNVYAIGLLNSLNEFSKQLKEESNMLLISDFHQLVNEVVRDSPAPFIYERLGNRYKHILIDEFQDTSGLQWANAVPLVQNTLSEGNMSLLVGDAKQSIYRWRGGRVEQFVELPKVNVETSFANSHSFFKSHFKEEILEHNYRSARAIIDFNNRFYRALAPTLESKSVVYDKQEQLPVRGQEGYVQIDRVEGSDKEDRWPQTSALILEYVQQSIADGYRPCDIAVLTRKGDTEGSLIANLLVENSFEVVTQGSFLLNNSAQVRAVMAYLNYKADASNHFAAVDFVQCLKEINPLISMDDFVQNHIIKQGKKITITLESFLGKHYSLSHIEDVQSIYAQAMDIIQQFKLKIDIYLECLLDHIRERSISRNLSIAALLEWWNTSKGKIFIASSSSENAIRIMTVHKSKGLQFPVVIYPRFSTKDLYDSIWIKTNEEEMILPTALVQSKSMNEAEEDSPVTWPVEFHEESAKSHLDDMNLCYVATTRAEDRLYIVAEKKPSKEKDNSKGGTWLSRQIDAVLDNTFKENGESNRWTFGTPATVVKTSGSEAKVTLPAEVSSPVQLKLAPSRIADDHSNEILMGNLIHQTLAEVQSPNTLEQAVQRVAKLHLLDLETADQLKKEVNAIITHPAFAKWFDHQPLLFSEREICTADGKIFRPDRVIVFEDHVIVLDFKTGKPSKQHEEQVKGYLRVLMEMFALPLKGYLLYTQDKTAIEVKVELDK